MLTVASMRQILAAAFNCPEDGVRPTLQALMAASLLPEKCAPVDRDPVAARPH